MRTEITSSPALAAARLRAHAVRARRWLWNRAPATRWALVVAVLVAVGGLGYVATPVAPVGDHLFEGHRFASDEIEAITHVLGAQNIRYRVDPQKRIEVAADRLVDATNLVTKLDVGPRSIRQIREWANQSDLWASPLEVEQRHIQARELILESTIRRLDGIVAAYVQINRPPRIRGWQRSPSDVTAVVSLETEQDREIGFKTIQSIQDRLVATVPELKRDAVSVFDQTGRQYLNAGNPSLGVLSQTRAREEELGEKILKQLHWINGVSVAVQLPPSPAHVESVAPSPVPVATPPAPAEEPEPPGPAIGFNRPLELEPEPEAAPVPSPVPVIPESAGEVKKGRIWVQVPRSFYKSLKRREPELEVATLASRTEKLIRTAVDVAVDRGELWDVMIDSIPDDTSASDPMPIRATSQVNRAFPWWPLAGTAAVVAVTLMVAAYRAVVSRRPVLRRARGADRGRYPIDTAPEPGHAPSERVRELVRFNPEAAAGVLQRWIGQGGHVG